MARGADGKSIAGDPGEPQHKSVTPTTRMILGAAFAGAVLLGVAWFLRPRSEKAGPSSPTLAPSAVSPAVPAPTVGATPPAASGADRGESPALARKRAIDALIARIESDYDEIRNKAAADYAAAGKSFPGGLNAFLRQLALLEREKRADLAKELTPRELEDYELRATNAGKLVTRLLEGSAATEAQRRAAFRHQLEFEDRYALVFDMSPGALAERETVRHATLDKIRRELGDEVFAVWLRGDGAEFGQMMDLVTKQGQPLAAALDLWSVRNEFTRSRLAILADKNLGRAQRQVALARLTEQTEIRVTSIVGLGGLQAGRDAGLNWLQKP